MKEDVACSVLRIMGVATMLVGAILTVQAFIARMALSESIRSAPASMQVHATGVFGDLGGYAVVAQAVTIVFGIASATAASSTSAPRA